jgi:hypothetical protein
MIETGLPTFSDSMRLMFGRSSSMRRASAPRASLRSLGVLSAQAGSAAVAACTASSTSAASLEGTAAMTDPVAGARTSSVAPPFASRQPPPMKFWWGMPRFFASAPLIASDPLVKVAEACEIARGGTP